MTTEPGLTLAGRRWLDGVLDAVEGARGVLLTVRTSGRGITVTVQRGTWCEGHQVAWLWLRDYQGDAWQYGLDTVRRMIDRLPR